MNYKEKKNVGDISQYSFLLISLVSMLRCIKSTMIKISVNFLVRGVHRSVRVVFVLNRQLT